MFSCICGGKPKVLLVSTCPWFPSSSPYIDGNWQSNLQVLFDFTYAELILVLVEFGATHIQIFD